MKTNPEPPARHIPPSVISRLQAAPFFREIMFTITFKDRCACKYNTKGGRIMLGYHPDPKCPRCDGTGYIEREQVYYEVSDVAERAGVDKARIYRDAGKRHYIIIPTHVASPDGTPISDGSFQLFKNFKKKNKKKKAGQSS